MTCSGTTRREAITSKNWSISSENKNRYFSLNGVDIGLLLIVIAMVGFGLLMVYSSSFIYAQERTGDGLAFIRKQFLFSIFGLGVMIPTAHIPTRFWKQWALPIAVGVFFLLVLIFVPGVGAKVGGAQRWLRVGPINIQPGELAKFALILLVAKQLERKRSRIHTFTAGVLSPYLLTLPAFLLLLMQPDFGTAAMIGIVVFFMLFVAGVKKRYLAGLFLLGGAIASALVLAVPYRRARLLTFLNPWEDPTGSGFQILQSLVGFHHGGIWGVGLGNGKEKLFYLPEAHNDFIFSVIGEELGFLGIAAVATAFIYFTYRGLRIAIDVYEVKGDRFASLLAAGITLALGLQAFVNMAVVLGLLPTKGLTLPFISYGGSALIIDLFAVGILLSIARETGPSRKGET